jgi:hypothetical protein
MLRPASCAARTRDMVAAIEMEGGLQAERSLPDDGDVERLAGPAGRG